MSDLTLVDARITHSLGTYLVIRQINKRLFVAVPEKPLASSIPPGYSYPTPRTVKFMGDFILEILSPKMYIHTAELDKMPDYGHN